MNVRLYQERGEPFCEKVLVEKLQVQLGELTMKRDAQSRHGHIRASYKDHESFAEVDVALVAFGGRRFEVEVEVREAGLRQVEGKEVRLVDCERGLKWRGSGGEGKAGFLLVAMKGKGGVYWIRRGFKRRWEVQVERRREMWREGGGL